VLRLLTARQIASYVALYGDEFPDPLSRLLDALDQVRVAGPREWKQLREDLAEEIGPQLGGLDAAKATQYGDQVVQWLLKVRSLSEEEFKAQRAELEKGARQIVGTVGPLEVLRHVVENALAEMLSNPRLEHALTARLK
jgi:hypothetical protein